MAASVAQASAFLAANPLFAFATLAALPIALWLLRDYLLRFPLRAFPSPPGIPLIGHVHYLLSKPWEAFARFAAQYGKVYVLRLWSKPFLVISDPELVKRVFQDEKRRYVKDQWSYDYFRADVDAGCSGAPGAASAASAAGSRSDRTTVPLGGGAALIELSSHFRKVTLEVIAQIAVGFDPEQAGVFPRLFEAVLDELNQRPYKPWRALWPPIEAPHRARLGELNGIVSTMIAARRAARASAAAGGGASSSGAASAAPAAAAAAAGDAAPDAAFAGGAGDMLDLILGSGVEMSDAAVSDELKTQLLAGHETSSALLTWTCYLLAAHPAVYARAQAEIDAELGGGAPSFANFRALSYLDCVLREAMRVYTPVPILNRECVEADELDGRAVAPGTGIIVSVWALHTSAALWGADVALFRPERFAPEEAKRRHAWAYMPFSQGERNCIGQNLAMMEAKVVLGSLLRRFTLSLPPGHAPPTTDSFIIPVRPHERLNLVVTRRAAPPTTSAAAGKGAAARSGGGDL